MRNTCSRAALGKGGEIIADAVTMTAGPRSGSARDHQGASLYDEVTARIIAELEAGRFPWVQPWRSAAGFGSGMDTGAGVSLPRNALTGRCYSGVNILLLWGAVIDAGFPSQSWLTFKQARDAGGCVRKGERGTTVVYADRFTPKGEAERAARDGDEAIVTLPKTLSDPAATVVVLERG